MLRCAFTAIVTGVSVMPRAIFAMVLPVARVSSWHLGESALPIMESSGVSTNFTKASYSSANDIAFAAQGVVGGSANLY